jgi:basic amino acid/polyamine antiporter, APA family
MTRPVLNGSIATGATTVSTRPRVSLTTAIAIAVADMIGIGVFTSLGFQVGDIPSGFALMTLWLIGGIAAMAGALCYAELAAALPRSGGEYTYMSRSLSPAAGFLAGWISITVGFAAPTALAAMAFGQYAAGVVPGLPALPIGLALVWVIGLVHLSGLKHSAQFQNVSTAIKIALIIGFIVAAFTLSDGAGGADGQPISFLPTAADPTYIFAPAFAVSLVFVMYSYSGWNAATYIADEIETPETTLPRALVIATLIVTVLYIGLNAAFLYSTPMAEMKGNIDIGLIAGKHIFGETGARLVGGLICFGLISTISAMMWIGPRVTKAMGEDTRVLSVFGRLSGRNVPANAILLQLVLVTAYMASQSFNDVLGYMQFSLTLCSFLTVAGMIVLRSTEPDLPRPYRTWGYPVTPLVFLSITLYMLVYWVQERPEQSLAGLATAATGLLVYAFSSAKSRPNSGLEPQSNV